jgi:hypothetical protein
LVGELGEYPELEDRSDRKGSLAVAFVDDIAFAASDVVDSDCRPWGEGGQVGVELRGRVSLAGLACVRLEQKALDAVRSIRGQRHGHGQAGSGR